MDGLFPGASDPYGCGLAIGWGMVGGGALGGAAAAVPGVVIGAAAGGITAGVAAPQCHPPTPTMAPDTMDSSGFASDPGQADMSNASFGSWGGGPTSYAGDGGGGGGGNLLCC